MNAEKIAGHLLDLLAVAKTWEQCPLTVVSHFAWETKPSDRKNRLAFVDKYREPILCICGCDPDRGGTGCRHQYRECWGDFAEQAPEWWWDVLHDRPEAKEKNKPL